VGKLKFLLTKETDEGDSFRKIERFLRNAELKIFYI